MNPHKPLFTLPIVCVFGFVLSNCSTSMLAPASPTPSLTPSRTLTPTVTSFPTPSNTLTPTVTQSPTISPSSILESGVFQTGFWEGEGVSFEITSEGLLHDLKIAIPIDEGMDCIMVMEDLTIAQDGTFSFGSPDEVNFISGTFEDSTHMSGRYGGSPISCEIENLTFLFQDPQNEVNMNATWTKPLVQDQTYDGTWSGLTSAGQKFQFVVENNVVTSLVVEFASLPKCESPYQMLNMGTEITEDTFSKTGLFSTVTGTFGSSTSASGDIQLLCDPALNLAWTASKNP